MAALIRAAFDDCKAETLANLGWCADMSSALEASLFSPEELGDLMGSLDLGGGRGDDDEDSS